MAKGSYSQNPICDDIPASLAREVGRIIVKWASFENRLQMLIWDLIGVDHSVGRIAIREPRIDDRLMMFHQLTVLKGAKPNEAVFKQVVTSAKAVERLRDLLAHSPWVKRGKEFRVISYKGNLPDQTIKHRSRRISPEGMSVSVEGLQKIVTTIDGLIAFTRASRRDLEKLLPSLRKSP